MRHTDGSTTDANGPGTYQIRLKWHLDQRWADRLEGLAFTLENDGVTSLSGPLPDQSALHGVLNRIRDLGIPIISVQRVGPIDQTPGDKTS